MNLDDFNKNFLIKLLGKVSKEKKSLYLLRDSNVKLLKYGDYTPTKKVLDFIA